MLIPQVGEIYVHKNGTSIQITRVWMTGSMKISKVTLVRDGREYLLDGEAWEALSPDLTLHKKPVPDRDAPPPTTGSLRLPSGRLGHRGSEEDAGRRKILRRERRHRGHEV